MSSYKIKQYQVTEPGFKNYISTETTPGKSADQGYQSYIYYNTSDGFLKDTLYKMTISKFKIAVSPSSDALTRPVYFVLTDGDGTDYIVQYITLSGIGLREGVNDAISFYFIPPNKYNRLKIYVDYSYAKFSDTIPIIQLSSYEAKIDKGENILKDGNANQFQIEGSPNDTFIINGETIKLNENGYYKLHGDINITNITCESKASDTTDYITATING